MTIQYTGSVFGTVRNHNEQTLSSVWQNAFVTLPNSGGAPKTGLLHTFTQETQAFPTVVFMHGSSGVNEQIRIFAYWLADSLGVATIVPDSMQTADRLTYSSPISPEDYEDIHKMRLQELTFAMRNLKNISFCDGRVIIAGTSEGGVAAARFQSSEGTMTEKARMIFSWSCEDNYHVRTHDTHISDDLPVLNIMSAQDKYFSQANSYLNNPNAVGHAGKTLANNHKAQIVLLPGAPHTLINLPQTRDMVQSFLMRILRS